MTAPHPPHSAALLAILAELGDRQGFTVREVASAYELRRIDVERALHNLRTRNPAKVHSAKTGHRTARYFGRKAWADAYLAIRGLVAYQPGFVAPRREAWARDLPAFTPPGLRVTRIPHSAPYLLRTNTHSIY